MEDQKTTITEQELYELNKELEDQNKDNPLIDRARAIGEPVADSEPADEPMDADIENAFQQGQAMDLFAASLETADKDEQYMDEITKEVSEKFDISVDDVMKMLDISKSRAAGEKFSLFGAMPEKIKGMINAQIMSTGNPLDNHSRALFTELFMDEFKSEFVDKYLDRGIVEFNKSIQETLGSITNVVDMYAGHIRYMMDVKLRQKAEETDNEAAKLIYLSCADAFTASYTYSKMFTAMEVKPKARRKLYKDNFQFNKFCRDFDWRNKDTKFSIRNVEQLTDNLVKHLGNELDLTVEDARAFTILFIKACDDLNLTQLPNALYVYYTIFNIVNLGFDTNKSSFYYTIVNNIKKVFNKMWEHTGNPRRFEIDPNLDNDDWLKEIPTEEELQAYTDEVMKGEEDSDGSK